MLRSERLRRDAVPALESTVEGSGLRVAKEKCDFADRQFLTRMFKDRLIRDFPEFVQQIGLAPADLWIVPVNDWEVIKRMHFEMAVFRAIENGAPMVRATSSGLSGSFDPWGRVLGVTDHFSGAPTLVSQVPRRPHALLLHCIEYPHQPGIPVTALECTNDTAELSSACVRDASLDQFSQRPSF